MVWSLITSLGMFISLSAFHGEIRTRIVIQSIIIGLVLTYLFDRFSFTKEQIEKIVSDIKFKLDVGELLRKEGLAKYACSTVRTGKLGVTTKRLIFQDLKRKEFSFMLADITDAEIRHTINPKEHIILLKLIDNSTRQFIVQELEEWLGIVRPSGLERSARA